MITAAAPPTAFAGHRYTIDTFPEDPAGETHDLATLRLEADRCELDGTVYGVEFQKRSGSYDLQNGQLTLAGDPAMALRVADKGPEFFWPGRDIPVSGLPQWEGRKITFHRVPDADRFSGELSTQEQNMVGQHRFVSERMGEFDMALNADRSGTIDGNLQGKPIHWVGQWMSQHPMSYFQIQGSDDFLSWHNNHDHGGHDHGSMMTAGDPVQHLHDMPVDVITATSGPDADIRKVYAMTMNPTQG